MTRERERETHALYNPSSDPRDMALDNFVPRRAEHKGTPRVERRQERIALLKSDLEVRKRLVQFLQEPVEFSFLRDN